MRRACFRPPPRIAAGARAIASAACDTPELAPTHESACRSEAVAQGCTDRKLFVRKPVKPGETLRVSNLVSDLLRVGRLVDPRGGRQLGRGGRLADEPLGVARVGGVEHDGAGGVELLRVAVVDGGAGSSARSRSGGAAWLYQWTNARQCARACSIVVEPGGELGPVLQRLEVRLRVGVVAGGVRAGCASS